MHLEDSRQPSHWITERVGTITWAVFRSRESLTAKALACDAEDAFIVPRYWAAGEVREGDPLLAPSAGESELGFECQGAVTAYRLAEATGRRVCLPTILVRALGGRKPSLVRVPCEGLPVLKQPVYLSADEDRVSAKFFTAACAMLARELVLCASAEDAELRIVRDSPPKKTILSRLLKP